MSSEQIILRIILNLSAPICGVLLGAFLLNKKKAKKEKEQKENEAFLKATQEHKPFTQADFERWKQDRGGYVDLDVLAGLFQKA